MRFTEQQLQAIEYPDGNLQLIACAGSGKTEVVARRITNILKTGRIAPSAIIAFTFTEKAAPELKERIHTRVRAELGDVAGMAEMYVGTIRGFALDLLKTEVPTIVDLKSTKRAQIEDLTEQQLHVYALGYEELTGRHADFVEIYNLDERKRKPRSVDSEFIEEVKQSVRAAAAALRSADLPPQPTPKKCEACDYRRMCSAGASVTDPIPTLRRAPRGAAKSKR